MSIEAMKQALEALERAVSTCFDRRVHQDVMSRPEHFINQTITALRTAIAKAEKQSAQRQWVGLTEAEINEWDYDTRDVVMDIEKLLREKNT